MKRKVYVIVDAEKRLLSPNTLLDNEVLSLDNHVDISEVMPPSISQRINIRDGRVAESRRDHTFWFDATMTRDDDMLPSTGQ